MKRILLVALILGLTGCASFSWRHYFPYTNENPDKFYKHLPNNFEDCLNQFDTLLSTKVINYFRNLDSSIAAIDISRKIGGLFINCWNLDYYSKYHERFDFNNSDGGIFYYTKRYTSIPPVLDSFINTGVTDPEAMIRVLFSAYYKRLNSVSYDWTTEINHINSYWIPAKYGEGELSHEMRKREHEILVNYHFNQLSPLDTVDILYNSPPELFSKEPEWYYLTGIIQFKIPENKTINIKLLDIKSETGQKYISTENRTIAIGDTVTDYCKGWLKRGIYYLDYNKNEEYRYGFDEIP